MWQRNLFLYHIPGKEKCLHHLSPISSHSIMTTLELVVYVIIVCLGLIDDRTPEAVKQNKVIFHCGFSIEEYVLYLK